jgi:putative membrane protein
MSDKKHSFRGDGAQVMRGICMGCADVVPGVSGGTVALILGIYERLVTAISHFDGRLLGFLRRRQWGEATRHIDLRFLVALAMGILSGVVCMTLLMNHLLTNETTRSLTLAAFFGMILASAVVVAKMIETDSPAQRLRCLLLGIAGAAVAYWISTLQHGTAEGAPPSYVYLFFCGGIAICAMILPGISGAMILLLLGVYVHLTEVPRNLLSGQHLAESLITLVVFATGCAVSLVGFSKVLRWLLANYHALTMATLCGFMFGALRKLWPFQQDLTPHIEKVKHKHFEVIWPETFDSHVAAVLVTVVLAMAFVFIADRFTQR